MSTISTKVILITGAGNNYNSIFFSSVPELNRFFRLTNIITVVTFNRVVPCYDEAGVME